MTFAPGDRVHLAGIGTGTVVERRGANRYAIEIKGRVVVASVRDLEHAAAEKARTRRSRSSSPPIVSTAGLQRGAGDKRRSETSREASIDLHGHTADEAIDALAAFLDDALVDGLVEVHVVHGRSGGRVKSAVHVYLRKLSSVASFRLDPRNPGVTIVKFA